MKFAGWNIDELFARCVDLDNGSLTMDAAEFAALRRLIAEKANSPVIPDGYKLVPVELLSTASMLIDLCRTHATLNGGGTYNQRVLSDCETTMNAIANLLAAAPTPTKAVNDGND